MVIIFLFFAYLASAIERFGSSKPHMLFHISERDKLSLNIGWGYFQDNTTNMTRLRLKYQNTDNQLYVNVQQHDGQKHFRQTIRDTNISMDSNIRFQNVVQEGMWEADISMKHNKTNTTINSFVFLTVENREYKTVDQVGYSTNKIMTVDQHKDFTKIKVQTVGRPDEVIFVKNTSKVQIFALGGNTSETWNIWAFANEYKNIRELIKYPKTPRTDDKSLKKWQNQQIESLKLNIWDRQYVVIFISTEFVDTNYFHVQWRQEIDSQYTPFNGELFNRKSFSLSSLYQGNQKQNLLKHTLFNLLGGIAYYFGPLYAQNSIIRHQETYTYSTTPSRLIFPRSFLWDDGFHMIVLLDKHPKKVLEFLGQWIDKIDLFGWIARQQIRGYEVSAMMPQMKFVFQDSFQANPPTLMLPIIYLIKHQPDNAELRALLKKNMWKLEKWFRYFKTTQSHYDLTDQEEINQDIKFRWRCKDQCKNGNFMGSGLDDYPRMDEGKLSKQHVDLISWLYFFSESLQTISQYLGESKGVRYYGSMKKFFNESLHQVHFDPTDALFKDVSVPQTHNINEFVTHIGYINLFPFITGMVYQKSVAFKAIMRILTEQRQLWSTYGLRSLSISDPLYSTGDNYWRGAVWIPINYLVLRACKLYYPDSTQKLYSELRENIIRVIQSNYLQTGYLYENYHQGKGNRGYPFYGWSSLVSSIILEIY